MFVIVNDILWLHYGIGYSLIYISNYVFSIIQNEVLIDDDDDDSDDGVEKEQGKMTQLMHTNITVYILYTLCTTALTSHCY